MSEDAIPDPRTIQPGYWLAATLPAGTAPLRCYVGQVATVDEHGVRLTLIDWLVGTPQGHDLYIAWSSILVALVGTPDDDHEHFVEAARRWQDSYNAERTPR